ncbi:MAG: LamB/YcsF family protein [Sphingobium sp.]|nr:MAG: LamB/YcsF family protein [Sphingobium sp.]
MISIDINADLGEGFGSYRCGDDAAMLGIVSSANIACGFHAGDPDIMAETFRVARAHDVQVGAHPSFPDLQGFGRRRLPYGADEIERIVAYQIGAAAGVAAYAGHRVTYVKVHGALANMAAEDRAVADAVARAVRGVDRSLGLLAIAASEQVSAGLDAGLAVYQEIYADRGYDDAGQLIRRGLPGALIEDVEEAADRALAMVREGAVICHSGKRIATPVRSICVHGDTSHAVAMARMLRTRLEAEGIVIAPFGPV